jgi:uncharacterized protein
VTGDADRSFSGPHSVWAERAARAEAEAAQLAERFSAALPQLRQRCAEFGVSELYLFGSLARGQQRPGSDVDLAVLGCPPERFYRFSAALERCLNTAVDVIDLELAPPDIRATLSAEGVRIYP